VALRRGGTSDLLEFLPPTRRTQPELAAALKKAGLEPVADMFSKQRSSEVTKQTTAHLREMIAGSDSNEEVLSVSFDLHTRQD